jgi:hypothetical protein
LYKQGTPIIFVRSFPTSIVFTKAVLGFNRGMKTIASGTPQTGSSRESLKKDARNLTAYFSQIQELPDK